MNLSRPNAGPMGTGMSRLAFTDSRMDTFLRLCLFTVPLRGLPLGFARDGGQSMSDDTLIIPHGATSVPLSGLGFSCHDAKKQLPLFRRADVSSGCIWLSEKVARSDCQITAYLPAALLTLRTVIFCRNELLLHPRLRWSKDGAI